MKRTRFRFMHGHACSRVYILFTRTFKLQNLQNISSERYSFDICTHPLKLSLEFFFQLKTRFVTNVNYTFDNIYSRYKTGLTV